MKTWRLSAATSKSHMPSIVKSEEREANFIQLRRSRPFPGLLSLIFFSTITVDALKEYGWIFNDDPRYKKSEEDTEALYTLVPVGSNGAIGMHQPPKNSKASKGKSGRVFESRILENIDRLTLELKDLGIRMKLPVDWGVCRSV